MKRSKRIWKWIIGFEGIYKICEDGTIKSMDRLVRTTDKYGNENQRTVRGKILKPSIRHDGYLFFNLRRNGKSHICHLHCLTLAAFKGPCPEGMEGRHLNDINSDNRLENLEWGTRSDNILDAIRNGCRPKHGYNNKLTPRKIRKIRRLHKTKQFQQKQLAKMFKITSKAIRDITQNKTWRHVK